MARGGLVERAGWSSAPCQHHTASSGALATSQCGLGACTCHLCGRSTTRAAPCTRGADVRPHQGVALYATVLSAILQGFPRAGSPCVADGLGRLALAEPSASGPPPAIAPPCLPHTATPGRPHGTRDPYHRPNTARCGPPVGVPTGSQAVRRAQPAPDTRRHPSVPRLPCVAVPQRPSPSSCWCTRSSSMEGCVPTGDAPRTYGRRSHVPTGDTPTYLRETNFTISLYDTISYAF